MDPIEALNSKSVEKRVRAAQTLGESGNAAAIPALIQVLQDRSSVVQMAAADALGQIGDVAAVTALVQTLRDSNWDVKQHAAYALANIGVKAVPALAETLYHRDQDVRRCVVQSLVTIGSDATPLLIQVLHHPTFYAQIAAAEALGKMGNVAAVPAVIQALQDSNAYVRISAATALGQLGDASAVPSLVQALRDKHVRQHAAAALGKIGDRAALPALAQLLTDVKPNRYDDLDYGLRQVVIKALGQIGDSSLSTLIEALTDNHPAVRSQAAEALGNIGDDAAVPFLRRALEDRVRDVRYAAADALGNIPNITDITIIPALLKVVDDSLLDWRVFNTLDKVGDTNTLPRKVLAATHISVADRIEILEAMGHARRYKILSVEQYCTELLQRDDSPEDVKTGAREVLARRMLLRPGGCDAEPKPVELLRAASSSEDKASPGEALRPSSAPQETVPQEKQRESRFRTLWQRLFA